MALAGGVCLSLLGRASRRLQDRGPLVRCAVGSGIITTVELLFGCVFNLGLHLSVWDYSADSLAALCEVLCGGECTGRMPVKI